MGVIFGAGIGLVLLLLFAMLVKALLRICGPNEALVISGSVKGRTVDGRQRGYVPLIGGRAWAIPVIQRVDRMSIALMEVPIGVRNGYSKGGIAMNVDAIANVKVSSDDLVIGNAVERFLNRDVNEIRRVSKETLEGHLRGVIATLTPEQVNEDRLVFAEALARESEEDLRKLGLHLDTLKILHVSDEVGYLDATGRKAIANIVRAAEIAESDAKRIAEQQESSNSGRANVTRATVEANVVAMRNELRKFQADLESTVNSEEERTKAAAREARATAEQKLQAIRAELEAIRLQVEKVLPAEADRQAKEYRARGEAAIIRERGRAVADALDLLHGAWKEAGDSALQIVMIEEIEKLISAAAAGVKKVQVDKVSLIDSGDGMTLPNYLSAYPKMLESVFDAVNATTGIDVTGAVSGRPSAKPVANQEEQA